MISIKLNKKRKTNNLKVPKVTDHVGRAISKQMEEDFSFTMIMMQKMTKIQHRNLTIFLINFKSLSCETSLKFINDIFLYFSIYF